MFYIYFIYIYIAKYICQFDQMSALQYFFYNAGLGSFNI